MRQVEKTNTPAVISNALKSWPAMNNWTFEVKKISGSSRSDTSSHPLSFLFDKSRNWQRTTRTSASSAERMMKVIL